MDVRLPSITHRVPFRFRENLARFSKDLHDSGPVSLDALFAAQGEDFAGELVVGCKVCGLKYHPDCATCSMGGAA